MLARTARRRAGSDFIWPGFVDALSSLLLVIIFLLSIFMLAQFFLGQALSGRDDALTQLRSQVTELSSLLRLEQQANAEFQLNLGQLSASLQTTRLDREELLAQVTSLQSSLDDANARLTRASARGEDAEAALADLQADFNVSQDDLQAEQSLTSAARAEIAQLTAGLNALRTQLAELATALEASEARDIEQGAIIADLGRRLNVALAGKVAELAEYRSVFYGRLREILGERADIRIEGDRFVFQAELLFASASADLGFDGQLQLRTLAATLLEIATEIPDDINWILRVDGHTDARPISTSRFPSNWELSTARAISVVKFLILQGVPAGRLAATGFGEFQPIVEGDTADALNQNRRIEMRFTNR